MKSYKNIYEKATKDIMQLAERIDVSVQNKLELKYNLTDITYVLRELYKRKDFHDKFTGGDFNEDKWSKGMCALASKCIYELYGGEELWDIYAIKPGVWEKGPVVFLRDKFNDISFGTTGEHFMERIPYELGTMLNKDLKTPNINEFMSIVKSELDKR